MAKKKQGSERGSSSCSMGKEDQKLDFKSIMKDIEYLGSTHMTWKEKKALENKKVVSLGGKPDKAQRLPLSVARVAMKKQKEREAKMEQENLILGRFSGSHGRDSKKQDRRKPDGRVLKSTQGHFRNGVLDVKSLLKHSNSRANDDDSRAPGKRNNKKVGKKNKGKKNGHRNRG